MVKNHNIGIGILTDAITDFGSIPKDRLIFAAFTDIIHQTMGAASEFAASGINSKDPISAERQMERLSALRPGIMSRHDKQVESVLLMGLSKHEADMLLLVSGIVAKEIGGKIVEACDALTNKLVALGDTVPLYTELLEKGLRRMETELFDGEYFIQKVEWKDLRAQNPVEVKSMVGDYTPEARALLEKEGPKYQYGRGCLADGVLGSWLALVCGVGQVVDAKKNANHLKAVHKYNLKPDLTAHPNPQRPSYACGEEGGLLLCTWPKGGELSLPFVYSNEVWTGIEYQVASHLMLMGYVNEGLDIVCAARDRYDGRVRNPFNEYECGHWYARAMSSYGLLQGRAGARYDAVEKTLYLQPSIKGDFRSFISTATGYGIVGVKRRKPFLEVKAGTIDCREIKFTAKA